MADSLPPETLLDVRPDLARGEEPFSKIMSAARSVQPGGRLVVLTPFEPEPLYGVLAKMGFSNVTEALGSEGFRVTFQRQGTAEEP
jgi:uncharacterized protein (DUF2249 family)